MTNASISQLDATLRSEGISFHVSVERTAWMHGVPSEFFFPGTRLSIDIVDAFN